MPGGRQLPGRAGLGIRGAEPIHDVLGSLGGAVLPLEGGLMEMCIDLGR